MMTPSTTSVAVFILAGCLFACGESEVLSTNNAELDLSESACMPAGPAYFVTAARMEGVSNIFTSDPTFPLHRTLAGYEDADIINLWTEAEADVLEKYGIDFSGVELDIDSRKVTSDGAFSLAASQDAIGTAVIGTSKHGDLSNCPLDFPYEAIVLEVHLDSTFFGSFGGEGGRPALVGSYSFFGSYFVDLNGNGLRSRVSFSSVHPEHIDQYGGVAVERSLWNADLGSGLEMTYVRHVFDVDSTRTVTAQGIATFPLTWAADQQ